MLIDDGNNWDNHLIQAIHRMRPIDDVLQGRHSIAGSGSRPPAPDPALPGLATPPFEARARPLNGGSSSQGRPGRPGNNPTLLKGKQREASLPGTGQKAEGGPPAPPPENQTRIFHAVTGKYAFAGKCAPGS